MNEAQIKSLVQAVVERRASREELDAISSLLKQDETGEVTRQVEAIIDGYEQKGRSVLAAQEIEAMANAVLSADKGFNDQRSSPGVVLKINAWKKIAVAASIIGLIFLTYYVINTREQVVNGPSSVVQTDVPAPDKNRAQIKLADGTIIYLDSAANGQLATQSNVVVTKTADGKIVYEHSGSSPQGEAGVRYNTLINPRGSIVMNMTLSDGSKVWLNAGSSITYPVAFVGTERKITMTGEGYFEITRSVTASGAKQSFIVSANSKADVTVLGTHFNVNAYDDEQETKITLLEGSVQVSAPSVNTSVPGVYPERGRRVVKIKPGQQVVLTQNSELRTNNSPDLEQTMAWKNGLFNFNNADIKEILRQAARWYNLEVVYSGTVTNDKYKGKINRDAKLSELLKILELNKVKFKIEGNRLTVM